jgi:hypothetical protein
MKELKDYTDDELVEELARRDITTTASYETYLIECQGGCGHELHGPYKNEEERDRDAVRIHQADEDNVAVILDIRAGVPEVYCYSGGQMETLIVAAEAEELAQKQTEQKLSEEQERRKQEVLDWLTYPIIKDPAEAIQIAGTIGRITTGGPVVISKDMNTLYGHSKGKKYIAGYWHTSEHEGEPSGWLLKKEWKEA